MQLENTICGKLKKSFTSHLKGLSIVLELLTFEYFLFLFFYPLVINHGSVSNKVGEYDLSAMRHYEAFYSIS